MNRKERDRITIMVGIKKGELTLAAAAPLRGSGGFNLGSYIDFAPNGADQDSTSSRV